MATATPAQTAPVQWGQGQLPTAAQTASQTGRETQTKPQPVFKDFASI